MANFTLADVRQAAASAVGTALWEGALGDQVIASRADSYFEAKASEAMRIPAKHFDIFLSHAYKDKVIVTGLYSLLTASGFSVYVDWIQDRHRLDRSKVTAGNAAILRERMRQRSSLFYATTDNYKDSRWMPCECGYCDGYDGKQLYDGVQARHVAILPVLSSAAESFNGAEYLGLHIRLLKNGIGRGETSTSKASKSPRTISTSTSGFRTDILEP